MCGCLICKPAAFSEEKVYKIQNITLKEFVNFTGQKMGIGDRLKLIRGSMKQQDFAKEFDCNKSTYGNWERGSQFPNALDIEKILTAFPFINPTWLLTGEGSMHRIEPGGHVANGNNIVQGAHIEADDVHLTVHQVGEQPAPNYGDPFDVLFLKDWKKLTDVGKMRVWTLLKEEIEREKS